MNLKIKTNSLKFILFCGLGFFILAIIFSKNTFISVCCVLFSFFFTITFLILLFIRKVLKKTAILSPKFWKISGISLFFLILIFYYGSKYPAPQKIENKNTETPQITENIEPTLTPTIIETQTSSITPTKIITKTPTIAPTKIPTLTPTPTQIKPTAVPTLIPTQKPSETTSQINAVRKAKSYLSYTSFSHDGLVTQLEYEQFSHADAVYGADNSGANWNEQAAKKAKSYMEYSSFSRGSLIDQLKYEKFTQQQAEYGANSVGL